MNRVKRRPFINRILESTDFKRENMINNMKNKSIIYIVHKYFYYLPDREGSSYRKCIVNLNEKKKLLFNINDEYVIYNLWLFYIFTAIVRKGMNNYETKLTR